MDKQCSKEQAEKLLQQAKEVYQGAPAALPFTVNECHRMIYKLQHQITELQAELDRLNHPEYEQTDDDRQW